LPHRRFSNREQVEERSQRLAAMEPATIDPEKMRNEWTLEPCVFGVKRKERVRVVARKGFVPGEVYSLDRG
jgi:hypothetical protein